MSAEERLYSLAAHLKMLEAYLNDLIARESTIIRFLQEARLVIDAIRGLSSSTGEIDTLLPLGIGVYVHAKVNANDKLLVSIGSDIAIEKGKDDAINYIEGRVKELENALVAINNQKQEIQMRIESIRGEMNTIIQQSAQVKG
jgi:prefoldin, archaeal alpha subunit/eukaryotic subunit 5